MMAFENTKQGNQVVPNGAQTPGFLSNNGAGVYDDLEGQLFGPIPPYLTQGQQQFDFQGPMDTGGMMPNMHVPNMNYHTGTTPNGDMNFVLSGDANDWGNMIRDPRYQQ